MSTKSYTLADSKIATVNVEENGVELNEALDVITKAIKAKVITTVGTNSKPIPTLELGAWSVNNNVYTADILYTGDGTLSTNVGTISGSTIRVSDVDGVFTGVIRASAGAKYAAINLPFDFSRAIIQTRIPAKPIPTLYLGSWTQNGNTYSAQITYTGDGTLSTTMGTISNGTLTIVNLDGAFSGTITASEGDDYAPTKFAFSYAYVPAKPIPTLALGDWTKNGSTYYAEITYDGDGELSTNIGTISNGTLIIEDNDGAFSGMLIAKESTNYAPAKISFKYKYTQIIPTLTLGAWTKDGNTYSAQITYDGDGELSSDIGTISGNTITVEDDDGLFSVTITASGTDRYLARVWTFNRKMYFHSFFYELENKRWQLEWGGNGTMYVYADMQPVTLDENNSFYDADANKSGHTVLMLLTDDIASGHYAAWALCENIGGEYVQTSSWA